MLIPLIGWQGVMLTGGRRLHTGAVVGKPPNFKAYADAFQSGAR